MKIVIGGCMNQEENQKIVCSCDPEVQVDIMDDMGAAAAVKSGKYDYYLGSCQTGAGGALAMPIALLGRKKCVTVAGAGFYMPREEIRENIENGKVAFGFVPEAAETVIPVIIKILKENQIKGGNL